MLYADKISELTVVIVTIVIFLCLIIIVSYTKFNKKREKRYKETLKIVNEKKNIGILENNKLITDQINIIMMELYNKYLCFIENFNNNKKEFDNILDGFIKELYENKIDLYTNKNHYEIISDIDLINYSLIKFDSNKIEFRIKIICFSYQERCGQIISGSNLEKVEQITVLTGINKNGEWLISNIDNVYEKKLSN